MSNKIERIDVRITEEESKKLRVIKRKLGTKNTSEAIRICICDYWEKI